MNEIVVESTTCPSIRKWSIPSYSKQDEMRFRMVTHCEKIKQRCPSARREGRSERIYRNLAEDANVIPDSYK